MGLNSFKLAKILFGLLLAASITNSKNNLKLALNYFDVSGSISFEYFKYGKINFGGYIEGVQNFCIVCDEWSGYVYLINPSILIGKNYWLKNLELSCYSGFGYFYGRERFQKRGQRPPDYKNYSSLNIPIKFESVYYIDIGKSKMGIGLLGRYELNFSKSFFGIGFPVSFVF